MSIKKRMIKKTVVNHIPDFYTTFKKNELELYYRRERFPSYVVTRNCRARKIICYFHS